jgi:predicted transcriptional regulator
MKDLQPKLIRLFKEDYCTPQIGRIAREIDEPAATIHYNIKKLENSEQ